IGAGGENDGNRCGRRLGRERRRVAGGYNRPHLTADQIGSQRRQSLVLTLGIAVLDRHIAALDVAGFAQASAEGGREAGTWLTPTRVEISDHRHRWLLRPRRERPCEGAADQRYELAASHSISSSARPRSESGTV